MTTQTEGSRSLIHGKFSGFSISIATRVKRHGEPKCNGEVNTLKKQIASKQFNHTDWTFLKLFLMEWKSEGPSSSNQNVH